MVVFCIFLCLLLVGGWVLILRRLRCWCCSVLKMLRIGVSSFDVVLVVMMLLFLWNLVIRLRICGWWYCVGLLWLSSRWVVILFCGVVMKFFCIDRLLFGNRWNSFWLILMVFISGCGLLWMFGVFYGFGYWLFRWFCWVGLSGLMFV